MINKIFLLFLLLNSFNSKTILVFHGLGDNCSNPGMKDFTEYLHKQTGNKSICIETGAGFYESFENQCNTACEKIEKIIDIESEVHLIGLSQGGLIARYVLENCKLSVRFLSLISVGGPQYGVSKFPHCNKKSLFCEMINKITNNDVYNSNIQKTIGPAGYFRTNKNINLYKSKSTVLSPLNNERDYSSDRKSLFISLNHLVLIMFSKDTMIIPKETAWFGYFDEHGETRKYNESEVYLDDTIGLKELDKNEKIIFSSIDGDHLQFKNHDIDNLMIPYLK